MPHYTTSSLVRIRDGWNEAGLNQTVIAPIVDIALARSAELQTQYRELKDRQVDRRRAVLAGLAAGELTVDQAVLEERQALTTTEQRQRADRLYREAVGLVCRHACGELRRLGDTLIVDHLAPAYAELVARTTKLAPLADGIHTDAEAMTADTKVRNAWGEILDAETKSRGHLRILQGLSQAEAITPLPGSLYHGLRFYARPDLLPRGQARLHPVRSWVAAIDAGMGPGIYTAEQAQVNHDAMLELERTGATAGSVAADAGVVV